MPVFGIDASRAVKKEKTGVEWYSYFLLRAMEKCTPLDWRVRLYVSSMEHGAWSIEHRNWEWRVLHWSGRGWTQGRLSIEMMMHPPEVLFIPAHVVPLVHPEKTVTTVHDIMFAAHPELYSPEDLEAQKRGLEFALRFAKKIIVPTRVVRDEVVAVGAKGEQVVVIPHGVEIASVHNAPQPPLALRGGEGGVTAPYILFVGRIEKKKNVLGLIQAMRDLKGDTKLILVGSLGYGGEDVLQAIRTFKLQERVVHLGYVDRGQYLALLAHAGLVVVPSFGEGFGLPVLEAMAVGVPVVCSDIPVLHEVGGNAVQYVDPHDPEDIARGIRTVCDNDMLRSEMARAGKERAREYSWERCAKETWNVICNLNGPL